MDPGPIGWLVFVVGGACLMLGFLLGIAFQTPDGEDDSP